MCWIAQIFAVRAAPGPSKHTPDQFFSMPFYEKKQWQNQKAGRAQKKGGSYWLFPVSPQQLQDLAEIMNHRFV